MKSFTEYLTESKKVYEFKIKVAGECPKDCASQVKKALAQYKVEKCSAGKSTPIQETQEEFPGLEISHFKYTETFLLLLSGGVTAKIWYPKLSRKILRLIEKIDNLLCKVSPRIFAFQMQVVIERIH